MVPGSTLMYGSNFCSCTSSPRATSSRPIEAAAMPLPSEETTPPVMKMNRVSPGAIDLTPSLAVPNAFQGSAPGGRQGGFEDVTLGGGLEQLAGVLLGRPVALPCAEHP